MPPDARTETVSQAAATHSLEAMKREAARRALDFVRPGMRLGLGTGSTAAHFVELLAERVKQGLDVIGVPTSEATRAQAERLGVPLTTLDDEPELDLTVDGADEIDHHINLIKGGGGALLREKIVAAASRDMVVIADESKWVSRLGRFPLPIEVVDFGLGATKKAIAAVVLESGCSGPIQLRHKPDGHVFVTDQGHLILDAGLGSIPDARKLAQGLSRIPGVVEHGLFIGLARRAVLAGSEGVRVIERS
jgi:ribose 5-phosphate isomerase A